MTAPKDYRIKIAGIARAFPVVEVAPGVRIAVVNLLGDHELAEAAGEALAELVPPTTEVLVMPEGKALALLHVIQRETGLPAVVPRKRKTSYMPEPVLDMDAVSITTRSPHTFFIGADDVAKLKGKDVALVDDIVSSGGTQKAVEALLDKAGAIVVGTLAIGTEGAERDDVIRLHHFPVFTG